MLISHLRRPSVRNIGPVFVLLLVILFVGVCGLTFWQLHSIREHTQVLAPPSEVPKEKSPPREPEHLESTSKSKRIVSSFEVTEPSLGFDEERVKKGLNLSQEEF